MLKKKLQKETGFTVVELLVATAIFGVIIAGVAKVFEVSNRSYMVQEDMAAMHQNVRVSKMFIERDVRMAGFGLEDFTYGDSRVYGLTFENADGASGSDKLTIKYINYDAGVCGDDPGGLVDSCDDLPDLTLTNGMPLNATVAIVGEDLETAPYSDWDNDCYCGGTTYTQPTPGFRFIVIPPTGSPVDVVFLTGTLPNSDELSNGPNFTADDGNTYDNKVLNSFPNGSTIKFFSEDSLVEVVYDLVGGVLRRNEEAFAEHIDDLQFAFGLDTDADSFVDLWIDNADLTDPQKDQVRLVRISVLGRTANEHRGFSGSRPALEDHAASGTTDGYRRRLLQVTVKVRNLGL